MQFMAFAQALLLFSCGCQSLKHNGSPTTRDAIPHVLHKQASGTDESEWPKVWRICLLSWQRIYHDWDLRVWKDEDVDRLVKQSYPEHWSWFSALPHKIMREDAGRAFILHAYGGVYSDMDMYVYKKLPFPQTGQVAVITAENARGEIMQNSLMASPPKHPFWEAAFLQMKTFLQQNPHTWTTTKFKGSSGFADYVVEGTGPNMLKNTVQRYGLQQMVAILGPQSEYQGHPNCSPETCFARHVQTGCWQMPCGVPHIDLKNEIWLLQNQVPSYLKDRVEQTIAFVLSNGTRPDSIAFF
eukprot:TRINITY_DN3266_c0_g1_i2.p1 TRINITY_DN3266_c0_g1~~TRINITY_DN3266_c0_g1_i2.p1  ORF type:complete len:298 (+),score=42.96 TRINITY_DN3266_c0_g1_i2:81-974(+)